MRQSFRGIGVLFVVSVVGIVAIIWVVLPVVEEAFSFLMRGPDATTIAEVQRRARAR